MKKLALIAGILMAAPITLNAETQWAFQPTDSFRTCHERALDQEPPPYAADLDISECMATQELAYKTALGVLSDLRSFNNPILEVLISACHSTDPKPKPAEWVSVFECMITLQEHGEWDEWEEEFPPSEEFREAFGNRQNLIGFASIICLKHPRYGSYAFYDTESNQRLLFLVYCVNPFANALEAWEF